MAVYIKRQIILDASQKPSGTRMLFTRGDNCVKFDALSILNEAGMRKLLIPASSTDFDLMQVGVTTGRILYIEADAEIRIKLSDVGDTGFIVKPVVDARGLLSDAPGTFYLESTFTHVYVTVPGASDVNLIVAILGE